MKRHILACALLLFAVLFASSQPVLAAKLTLDLGNVQGIKLWAPSSAWDSDGNANKLVDKDQKIDQPQVQFTAEDSGHGKWVFADLPPASYDLVIMLDKVRIEGFSYPPVMEFDPFIPPTATAVEEAQTYISDDIKKSPQYENKMACLYCGGNKKVTRALVQLLAGQAHQLHARCRHPAARGLGVRLALRRLAEEQAHQGSRPHHHPDFRAPHLDLGVGAEAGNDRGQKCPW